MKFSKERAVLYLERDRFDFYSPALSDIAHFDIPSKTVKDLEVINQDELNILIKAFIEFYKIAPSSITLILSDNICFVKDLTNIQENLRMFEVQKFIDYIPFENAASKIFTLEKEVKVISTNLDLYQAVKNAFEKQGFTVDAVVPALVLRVETDLKGSLDLKTARLIAGKTDTLKQNSLQTSPLTPATESIDKEEKSKVRPKLSLIILLIILFSLLAVLGFLLLKNFSTP